MTAMVIHIENNKTAQQIYGVHSEWLHYIAEKCGADLADKGNKITIKNPNPNYDFQAIFNQLVAVCEQGKPINMGVIDHAIMNGARFAGEKRLNQLQIRKKTIFLRTQNQCKFVETMHENDMSFAIGPAGTGKTFLAVAYGVSLLLSGAVERLILSRPAVEAGENLGFLPGDLQEKVSPYLRPIYDILDELISAPEFTRMKDMGQVQIAPLAYMRGRTLKNAFIILDEAQNTTKMQMKMFLTRMGEGSKMVITGDPSQNDIGKPEYSGLNDAWGRLQNIKGIGFAQFTPADITRHHLVQKIVEAYQ